MQKTIDRYLQDIQLPRMTFFEEQINAAVGVIIQNNVGVYKVRKDTARQRKIACTMLIEGLYQTYCTFSANLRAL